MGTCGECWWWDQIAEQPTCGNCRELTVSCRETGKNFGCTHFTPKPAATASQDASLPCCTLCGKPLPASGAMCGCMRTLGDQIIGNLNPVTSMVAERQVNPKTRGQEVAEGMTSMFHHTLGHGIVIEFQALRAEMPVHPHHRLPIAEMRAAISSAIDAERAAAVEEYKRGIREDSLNDPRQRFHEMLDTAMDTTHEGDAFLSRFVAMIISDLATKENHTTAPSYRVGQRVEVRK